MDRKKNVDPGGEASNRKGEVDRLIVRALVIDLAVVLCAVGLLVFELYEFSLDAQTRGVMTIRPLGLVCGLSGLQLVLIVLNVWMAMKAFRVGKESGQGFMTAVVLLVCCFFALAVISAATAGACAWAGVQFGS